MLGITSFINQISPLNQAIRGFLKPRHSQDKRINSQARAIFYTLGAVLCAALSLKLGQPLLLIPALFLGLLAIWECTRNPDGYSSSRSRSSWFGGASRCRDYSGSTNYYWSPLTSTVRNTARSVKNADSWAGSIAKRTEGWSDGVPVHGAGRQMPGLDPRRGNGLGSR